METSQLVLIDKLILIDDEGTRTSGWRIDEHTREVGRQGVAEARRALAAAIASHHGEPDDSHSSAA